MLIPPTALAFENELSRRGVPFARTGDPLVYAVHHRGLELSVSLQNIDRNFRRGQDPGAIGALIDAALACGELESVWEEVQRHIYLSLEPSDTDFSGALVGDLSPRARKVLVEASPDHRTVRWLSWSDISRWGISQAEVEAAALSNLNSLLVGLSPEVSHVAGSMLGMIPVHEPFKASVLLAPALKAFASPSLGWPILAVLPCRDFVYILPESNGDLLNRLGGTVTQEYRNSGYPITTEVFRISDDGIRAIGKFPE